MATQVSVKDIHTGTCRPICRPIRVAAVYISGCVGLAAAEARRPQRLSAWSWWWREARLHVSCVTGNNATHTHALVICRIRYRRHNIAYVTACRLSSSSSRYIYPTSTPRPFHIKLCCLDCWTVHTGTLRARERANDGRHVVLDN